MEHSQNPGAPAPLAVADQALVVLEATQERATAAAVDLANIYILGRGVPAHVRETYEREATLLKLAQDTYLAAVGEIHTPTPGATKLEVVR